MFSVGIELGGQYLNKVSSGDGGLKTDVWSAPLFATAKFYIPHSAGLNVFGKAGYAYNRVTTKADGQSDSKETLWRPVAAAGLGYHLQQFNIFAQYQYNWLPYQGENGGVSTISAGVTYTLPM